MNPAAALLFVAGIFVPCQAAAQTSAVFPLDHFWTYTLDAPFAAPIAVDDRRVYVAVQTGHLLALEPGLPAPVWSSQINVEGAPVAAANRVFVPAGGAVQAIDAATGTVAWRLPAAKLAAPLTYREGWLIVALADGALQAVRASDGVVVWARTLEAPLAAPPSIDGNTMAVALADGGLAVLDLATGKPLWSRGRSLGARAVALTLSGDRIYAGTDNGDVWSIRTRDGHVDWRWEKLARLVGAPVADDERVYVIGVDNLVRGFSRGSGNQRWHQTLPTRALGGPIAIEGLLIVTTASAGAPGLTYIGAEKGTAGGASPALAKTDENVRIQFPAVMSSGAKPFVAIATATGSGAWQIHAYRQTFVQATLGPIVWGPRFEIRKRLEIRTGAIVWGLRINLVPPVPVVPRVP